MKPMCIHTYKYINKIYKTKYIRHTNNNIYTNTKT